ncbi:penicillin-insensitive murein endopeptidase [Stutzerimonas azotifigens]|uniref:penicillin-insensitive murein endopeptidase n=1 Tax=Stutzerimonas azotifigens TaxID=291995 RepID=UPI0004272959|nr:penicillin-insensitive murein endopeptidase [Stutzerimonas azotifigens]
MSAAVPTVPARALLARCTLVAGLALPALSPAQDWATVPGPLKGEPHIIGKHGAGCLIGAQALPPDGPGYQAIELERERYYGHPELVDYLLALGQRLADAGIGPMLVGDLAQPRGGPMSSGHVSHQTGLDVDIWFRLDLPPLPRDQRRDLEQPILVDERSGKLDERWTDAHAELVRQAANDPRVARIFVDGAIKRDLCERQWEDRSWLRRIRPWPAHDEHLHVRLRCPEGQVNCVDQPEPPAGDGCQAILPTPRPEIEARPIRRLPAACDAVLEQ